MKGAPLPCHVVAGPLGAGKTTAIISLLKRRAGRERTAVIVNDFGPVGIDQTILDGSGTDAAVDVTPIVGGCLCCTGPMYLRQALAELSRRTDIDRIIIEPSGVAMLKALKADLLKIAQSEPIELRPFITLIPPARITEGHYKALPFIAQLVDEADYLVANKADCASEEQLQHFRTWTSRLHSPKRGVIVTQFGDLPDELFELPSEMDIAASGTLAEHEHDHDHTRDHEHTHDHDHDPEHSHDQDHQVRGHWEVEGDVIVDIEPLKAFLRDALQRSGHEGLLRCKGVVRTQSGWQLLQWTEDGLALESFAPQETSRLEWIATGQSESDRLRRLLTG